MTGLRIAASWLMIIVAVLAVDFAVLLLLRGPGDKAVVRTLLPTIDVLAVLLATTAGRLRRRGEVSLSRVMFVLTGGIALIFFVYLVPLRPDLIYELVPNIAGRWGGERPLVRLLLNWLVFSVPILGPALFVGWATRGYRLKLTTCIDGRSAVARRG